MVWGDVGLGDLLQEGLRFLVMVIEGGIGHQARIILGLVDRTQLAVRASLY